MTIQRWLLLLFAHYRCSSRAIPSAYASGSLSYSAYLSLTFCLIAHAKIVAVVEVVFFRKLSIFQSVPVTEKAKAILKDYGCRDRRYTFNVAYAIKTTISPVNVIVSTGDVRFASGNRCIFFQADLQFPANNQHTSTASGCGRDFLPEHSQ